MTEEDVTQERERQPGASRYTIKVRVVKFDRYMRLAKFDSVYALAQAMGVHRSTIGRVMDGELKPGPAFIAGALTAFAPASFTELFEVVEDKSVVALRRDVLVGSFQLVVVCPGKQARVLAGLSLFP